MPWFRVDDGFHSHPKVVELNLDVVGLWTLAGTWSTNYLTDGLLTLKQIHRLGGDAETADQLVEAGLWERSGDDYLFRDWADYQPLKETVLAERRAAQERMANMRAKRKGVRADDGGTTEERSAGVPANTEGTSPEVRVPHPFPSHPSSSKEEDLAKREDVERLCQLLVSLMVANGDKKPNVTKTWRDETRRMLDIDGRTEEQASRLMRWALDNTFWRANIRSMPTFRDKFDQLRHQANKDLEERKQQKHPDEGRKVFKPHAD